MTAVGTFVAPFAVAQDSSAKNPEAKAEGQVFRYCSGSLSKESRTGPHRARGGGAKAEGHTNKPFKKPYIQFSIF